MKSLLFLISCFFSLVFAHTAKNGRIIGGDQAYAAQYPFIAAIYKSTSDGQYFCGGTIYSQQWILTAGQCVDNATLFTIYVGTNDIKNLDSTALKLAANEYVLHPDYNPLTLENDIGLIKLRMELTFSLYIRATSLMDMDLTPETNYGSLSAVGWGQTSDESAELTDKLQYAHVQLLSRDECKIIYGNQITNKMICAVGKYNEGTCHGDTGTPLVMSYRGSQTQHGIGSFVRANGCESTDPSGYTRINPYLAWIRNITGTV